MTSQLTHYAEHLNHRKKGACLGEACKNLYLAFAKYNYSCLV